MTALGQPATRPIVLVAQAAAAALGFCTLVLLAAGAPPFDALALILDGAFGSWLRLATVIRTWIPLCLCACGLLFTFRIGLWNIGVEGQVMAGAVMATAVLRWDAAPLSPGVFCTLSLAAAGVGGALWAWLAGWLKTRSGVNEIFAGLGLNFVAQSLILWLIFGPWKRPGVASMSGTEPLPESLWLFQDPSWRIAPVALVLTIAAVALTALVLSRSRMGLCLKAVGNNAVAAVLFGLRPAGLMLLAMLMAGGLAGMAGGLQVTAVYHRLIPSISSNYGYLALLVVLLSKDRALVAALVAFGFAALNVGSVQLPMALKLDSSLAGVIQGALALAAMGVGAYKKTRMKKWIAGWNHDNTF